MYILLNDCDIILLPFQGVNCYCNHYYPKVSLRSPLGYVRFAFALSGRFIINCYCCNYSGLKAQWLSIAQGKRSGTLGNVCHNIIQSPYL